MATSGSINFSLNRDEVIKAALRKLGVLAEGENPSSEQINNGAQALNVIVKAWQSQGIHLWKTKELTLFLTESQGKYTIDASSENATFDTIVQTAVNGAASSGASTITVDSITGISNGDIIGIELSSTSMQWTTVNGAPSGTTVTLTDTLTAAVADDAVVYVYTTKAPRVLRVVDARRKDSAGNDVPINVVPRDTYYAIPNKGTTGKTSQVYYDPQLTNGLVYLWPEPDDVTDFIQMTVQTTLEDFDATTDTPDLPQEWYRPLIYTLASDLAPEYGLDLNERAILHDMAEELKDEALSFDTEPNSIWFAPSTAYPWGN